MDKRMIFMAGGVGVLLLLWSAVFTVKETDRAMLLEFGQIVRPDVAPGIRVKLPWQDVRRFDARVQVMDTTPTEFVTRESNKLEVDAYVVWRIEDNQQFYTATGGGQLARARDLLAQRAIDGLKNKVSQRTLQEVVSGARDEMMAELTREVATTALAEIGVKVIDIRVKKVDYLDSNLEAVFRRMRTDREREAREFRAEGKEESEKIRSEAEKQRTVLLAEAFRDAQRLRGEGDAKSAAIYAASYGKDPDFFQFWRSMEAYRESLASPENIMVIQPDNPFFRQMKGN